MKYLLVVAVMVASTMAQIPDVEIAGLFSRNDVDGNGNITQTEYIDTTMSLDTNNDGIVSQTELFANSGDTMTEAAVLLRVLDYNKDGVVNRTDAMAMFMGMDANGDGQVNILEFANFVLANNFPSRGEIKLLASGADGVALWFRGLDTDKDGMLSTTEFNAVYTNIDADADGKVSRSEYNPLQTQLKLNNDEGDALFGISDANSDGFIDSTELTGIYQRMDADMNGAVTEPEFVIGVVEPIRDIKRALAMNGAVYPSIQDELVRLGNEGLGHLFASLDKDGDGALTLSEQNAEFDALDTDGDGILTRAQMVPFYASRLFVRNSTANAMFSALDSDDSGSLTKADSFSITQLADTNGDGSLDREEYTVLTTSLVVLSEDIAYGRMTLQTAREVIAAAVGLGKLFESFDVNMDGFIASTEFDSEIGQKLDLNGDGSVTMLEFIGAFARTFSTSIEEAAAVFHQIDSNNDQMIDSAESAGFYQSFDYDRDGTVSSKEFINNIIYRLTAVKASVAVQRLGGVLG